MAKFRTRARTIEMLGRQQIAGIPTAISELFKNAHDAYAKRVEVDYYRSDGLFVLRDDGLGMTLEDFEKRWLTLGTESKLDAKVGLEPPPVDQDQPMRPILGEKGIGRLAMASIGSQVLILTKAKREHKLHDLVAAYIHWGIFECPGVDLDEIEIPIRTFLDGQLPTRSDVDEMLNEFRECITNLHMIGPERTTDLLKDIEMFNVDPVEIDDYLGSPSLANDGHGTHFVILPAYDILQADIDEFSADKAPALQKALLGFTNTMTPDHSKPVIKAAFRDHKTDESPDDLIPEGAFFTPDEFINADHHIRGEFDEFGQFKGTVSIYGEEYPDHVISWRGARGLPTLCGPFKINVADVQGAGRESTIPLEDYGRLVSKLNKFGGLYIYHDGIRILPYGDTDYDWLYLEKNRTKSAYYYHFSYRKIFGVVEITHKANSNLKEKAGREGFLENKAYRQLKAILMNFFIQITADFFRDTGSYWEKYSERKGELERLELARRKRENLVSVKRRALSQSLREFFVNYDAGKPQEEALQLTKEISERLETASQISDPKEAAAVFLQIESDARQRISELQERYRMIKPRGVGLGKSLQKEWTDYLESSANLQETVFSPAVDLIENVVSAEAEKARLQLDRRLRIEQALDRISTEARRTTKKESTETRDALSKVEKVISQATRASLVEVEGVLKDVFAEFARLDVSGMEDAILVSTRNKLESRITDVKEKEQQFLQYIRDQLEAICLSENLAALDQMEAVEQKMLALEEQSDTDLQLTQLGMAVEIINHEFNNTVRSIRDNLKSLGAWADINRDLQGLYNNLRASFDHLDGYLTLFTPMQRRLHRTKVEISGANISKFLGDLFNERLTKTDIAIAPTKAFLRKTVKEYPSSLYPVFINLVDNALFWLKDRPEPRVVTLDADDKAFIVSDNGPGIPQRDREAIFEQGFTRKPGGRGMGLYISREVLRKIGYTIALDNTASKRGASFRIEPENTETN